MNLDFIDIIVIIFLLSITFFSGFIASKKTKNNEESYILAGRKLTTPLFVATLVATWYGSILGVGEFVYTNGTLAWLCLAFPYYISALIFALFFSSKIRAINVLSIPHQIEITYGKNASILAPFIILIVTLPSAYVLMLGVVVSDLTGLGLILSIIIGTVFSFSYIYKGGFNSDIYANLSQFVIMYLGFAIFLYFLIDSFGSPASLLDSIPEKYIFTLNYENLPYIISWFFIALQTFIDPSFFQRCSAARDTKTARNGILYSILFWIVFDLLTLVTGLYAINNIQTSEPINTYLLLGDLVLPPIFKGIFYSAIIATIMSTLNSYGFLSAVTIGNDILKKLEFNFKNPTKIGIIVTAVLSIIIASYIPSVIDIFYKTASITIPSIFLPLLLSFSNKIKIQDNKIILYMLLVFVISLISLILQTNQNSIFQPMQIGLLASIILLFVFKEKRIN